MNKRNWTDICIVFGSLILFNVVFPILDGLSSMAISAMNKKINKMQIDMQLDQAEGQAASDEIAPAPSITQAIGFQIDNPSYEEDDYGKKN